MPVPISPHRAGHIVALEGPSELVSTQLRLLPPSQHLLILPTLHHYLRETCSDAPWDPRELIHQYHTAAQARHAEALDFLHHSESTDGTRLVILHGGTMAAQVACLSAIMEHQTDGEIEEAYATFVWLTKNGAAKPSPTRLSYSSISEPRESMQRYEPPEPAASSEGEGPSDAWTGCMHVADNDTIEDRIIRAMRAADALDKETEFLQPATSDVDLTVKLVDIPSRSKSRPAPSADGAPEILRRSRSAGAKPSSLEEPARRVSPGAKSAEAEEAVSTAHQKPPLKIRIPSPPIPWAGDVASGKVPYQQRPSYETAPRPRRWISEPELSPSRISLSDGARDEPCRAFSKSQAQPSHREEAPVDPREPEIGQAVGTTGEPFESVLPMLEDLVVFFTHAATDDLHDYVVRRLSEVCKPPRLPISTPASPIHGAFQRNSHLISGEENQGVNEATFEHERASGASPWPRKDLVHGLPTPNHSPTTSDLTSMPTPLPKTSLLSIDVDQETAVSTQNMLRSVLVSQFALQGRHMASADGTEYPHQGGLWMPLESDGDVADPAAEPKLDLILAVGAETGVKKECVSEVVRQIEKLGFEASGHSRSGRLDIRFLIANAMQAFTAQPLTKQIQSNPFADRALLAALIIPHLEAYLETHPDVRFLLIEYPSEHLPTVLALQTLMGAETMKVVGIINRDASAPVQPPIVPDENRGPLNSRISRTPGTFARPCSFSKADFLLASSITGSDTVALVAAIRESLFSVSNHYMPERPLHKPPSSQFPPQRSHWSLTTGSNSHHSSPRRASGSTSLVITPPSSPTEPAALPTCPQQSSCRSAPSRSTSATAPSKSTSTSSPRGRRHLRTAHADSDVADTDPRVRWGQVIYAAAPPSSSSYPSSICSSSSYSSPHSVPSRTATDTDIDTRCTHTHTHTHSSHNQKLDLKPPSPARARETLHDPDFDEDDDDEDDDEMPDEEMRRLMPLYLRRREDVESMRSTKAFKWLGLA
ncbi:hypothetical protein N658DRAFT_432435 [Parathielavia hyrcaniae]|uniref:Uncharacterized protein n=1 Tax=Parathielavia hyrcaniae TaxID=113614 RepID=A0AAN6SZ59_9PEZI|nr:hypothetical protein N658DRAFT_432435 [Parathielavia hyrcaniae]